MSLLTFFVIVVIGGLCWYLLENYVPLPRPIQIVIRVVLVIVLIALVLALFKIAPLPFSLK